MIQRILIPREVCIPLLEDPSRWKWLDWKYGATLCKIEETLLYEIQERTPNVGKMSCTYCIRCVCVLIISVSSNCTRKSMQFKLCKR